MKVEIWYDFVCPYCYMGKRIFENVLAQFPHRDEVEVVFKSFQLDPQGELYSGKSLSQLLASKYGMSLSEANKANEQIGQQASKLGLEYKLEGIKPTNTLSAHRLVQYAKTEGKDQELIGKIQYNYFAEGKVISDYNALLEAAILVGLDKDEASEVIKDSSRYASDVNRDQLHAEKIGVDSVPFFLVNNKHSISGAQQDSVLLNTLNKAFKEI